MKYFITLFFLLPAIAFGQTSDEYPFRFQLHGCMASPVATFSKSSGNNYLLGQAGFGGGGGILLAYRIKGNLFAGLAVNSLVHPLDDAATRAQAYAKYAKPSHYTHINSVVDKLAVTNINAEVSFKKRTPVVEIEPFTRIGIAILDITGDIADRTAKQYNSNNSETTRTSALKISYVSPSIGFGVRLYKKIAARGGIAASAHYSYSSFSIPVNEKITNHLNKFSWGSPYTIKQPVQSIQYEVGIQFRFIKTQPR